MYVYIFIDSPKGNKSSIPFINFFYIFSPFSRIYILLSLLYYFLHISYCLYYILSYFILYPTFLRTSCHAMHASLALLFLSPYPHVPYLFSTFIHSLFPLPFRLPFLSHSFHSHSHSCSSPPPFSFWIYPIHVPMTLPLPHVLYIFSALPFPSTNLPKSFGYRFWIINCKIFNFESLFFIRDFEFGLTIGNIICMRWVSEKSTVSEAPSKVRCVCRWIFTHSLTGRR